LKKRGLMNMLVQSMENMQKDHTLRRDVAIMTYQMDSTNKVPAKKVQAIIDEAVAISTKFVVEAIPKAMEELGDDELVGCVVSAGDHILTRLNIKAKRHSEEDQQDQQKRTSSSTPTSNRLK
ncbi:hypothetical protein PFISCL1PPCAC_25850, partial [Pristionchus fissidentatus]